MDTAARARELALLGIESRATQSENTGTNTSSGGKTAHEPAGSPKGGQFTSKPSGGGLGYQSVLPAASAYGPKSSGAKKAPTGTGVPAAPAEPRTMKAGDSGEDVRYAQYAMNLLGFKVPQDGNYGPETEAAVKQIQERLGVKKPNGHLSSAQLRKLQDAVRLSPCIGGGQRDLAFEADWEARDVEETDGELDEDTEALIEALGEFIGDDERSFNEALHPRNPKGSVGGGRFRSITDRIVAALSDWKHGDGPDDPLKDFNREQLLKAAKAHGHTFRRGASIEEIKAQILDDVRTGTKAEKADRPNLPGTSNPDHRRFTIQLGGKVDPAAVREVEVENKIRAAYLDLAGTPGTSNWVMLSDLRNHMGEGTNRHEIDAALKRLAISREPGSAHLVPQANQKALTPADRQAALHMGGQEQHAISFEDASPRAPKPSGTATDVGIFGNPTTGKLSLYRESDTGKRTGRAIKSFDDMASLESWARDNGHAELADYAKAEQARTGGVAKVAKAAPAKAATLKKGDLVPAGSPIPETVADFPKVPRTRVEAGDFAVWQPPGEAPVYGRVVDLGPRKKFIDWEGGRRESLATTVSPDITFHREPPSDPLAGLEGLTTVQKRAKLRARGLSKAEIDAVAPLEKKVTFSAGTVAAQASAAAGGPRSPARLDAIKATMNGLNETQLRAVARQAGVKLPPKGKGGSLGTDSEAGLRTFIAKSLDSYLATKGNLATRARELDFLGVTRALGRDVTPGHDELHHWWTKGPGLARWISSPHQFTTLRDQLVEEAHVTPEVADRWAAAWVHEVTGFWPGSDMHRVLEGSKPRGHRIGPG